MDQTELKPLLDRLLLSKLSDGLNEEQKHNKVANLLSAMRRSGIIRNEGSKKAPKWLLAEKTQNKTNEDAD